jgi:hypothetical protein
MPLEPTLNYQNEADCHLNARLDYLSHLGARAPKGTHCADLLKAFTDCKAWVQRFADAIEAALQQLGPLAEL